MNLAVIISIHSWLMNQIEKKNVVLKVNFSNITQCHLLINKEKYYQEETMLEQK